jgi:hypothetical protein
MNEANLQLPNTPFINLISDIANLPEGRALLNLHGFLPVLSPPFTVGLTPKTSVGEILAIAKLICAGASIACPIIDDLP